MPHTPTRRSFRWLLTCAVLAGIALPGSHAFAQVNPGPPGGPPQQGAQANPTCGRLQGPLPTLDPRGGTAAPDQHHTPRTPANAAQSPATLDRPPSGGLGGPDRKNPRRAVFTALGQNHGGPQYAAAAARGPGNSPDNLFGGGNTNPLPPPGADF